MSSGHVFYFANSSLEPKEAKMGDKGKKDKGKREDQKKGLSTLKEKRQHKKDKGKSSSMFSNVSEKPKVTKKGI